MKDNPSWWDIALGPVPFSIALSICCYYVARAVSPAVAIAALAFMSSYLLCLNWDRVDVIASIFLDDDSE